MSPVKREDSGDSLIENGPRSEYKKRYPEYNVQKTQSYKPPHQPVAREGKVESLTVQRLDYPEHPIQKRQQYRPEHIRPDLGAFDGKASYKDEFPEWELPPRRPKEKVEWQPPELPVENKTTTNQDFPEHAIERRLPYKPDNTRPDLAAFDAQASYREEYPEWKITPRERRQREEWSPPAQPFQGTSTNTRDFPEHQVSPRVNHRPDMKPVQSDAPFQARTGYLDTFKEHPVQPRQRREREQWQKPAQPFDGTTTQMKDFTGIYAPKQPSLKPQNAPVSSGAPLDGNTTMSTTYKAHDLPIRYKHEPEKYQQPVGPMDLNTTSGTHYKEHALQRQTYERPGSSHLLKGEGAMSKTTNYQGDFVPRAIERRPIMKPDGGYVPPTKPMDATTTHQADFFERQVGKRESFRPRDEPTMSTQPFQDRTVNKDTFVPHKVTLREQKKKEVYQGPTAPLEDRTTVKDSYQGAYQRPRESFKPPSTLVKAEVPFQSNTTMNETFKAHELPEKFIHRQETYRRPSGPMDLNTTHGTNYREHQLQRQSYQRPGSSGLLRGHGEMVKSTNYQNNFAEPPPVKRELAKRQDTYQPPTAPMDATTTTGVSYKEPGISPRTVSYKPQNDYMKSNAKFDDKTSYRERFLQHEVQPRARKPREEHVPPSVPFEARTTAHDSYVAKYQRPRESFRPDQEFVKTDIPFESNTTAGSTYKPWPVNQRMRHKQDEYVRPEGFMDLTTINRETFKEVRAERQPIHRLTDSGLLAGTGKFENYTSYGSEFVPKSMEGRKLVKPDNKYVPSNLPFETNTTYRASHVGHVAPKERSRKPDQASDVLGQRDQANRFRIKGDWRDMFNMPAPVETVTA